MIHPSVPGIVATRCPRLCGGLRVGLRCDLTNGLQNGLQSFSVTKAKKEALRNSLLRKALSSAPCRTRTYNPLIKSQML